MRIPGGKRAKSRPGLAGFPNPSKSTRKDSRSSPTALLFKVNLGLTYLWSNQTDLGEQAFAKALREAEENPEEILELGDVFRINGVPDRSIAIYNRGRQIHPNFLNFYLRLQETFLSLDRQEESRAISESIERVFNPSPAVKGHH
jgi:tetratricopeptide (TPR) repeat protein